MNKLLNLLGENGEHFCRETHARDKYLNPVGILDETAVSWDLWGGMVKLYPSDKPTTIFNHYNMLEETMQAKFGVTTELPTFNDHADWSHIKMLIELYSEDF